MQINTSQQNDGIMDKELPKMKVEIFSQWTPNPNAYKFILSEFVINRGKLTYTRELDLNGVPLVKGLLSVPEVAQIHLFENVITVTQDGTQDWGALSEKVEKIIEDLMPTHNPEIGDGQTKNRENLPEKIREIEELLDRTIRPGLQGDGGDVEVIGLEDNVLTIHYEGACGTCPSSMSGTLNAITEIIRENVDRNIEVVAV